MRAYFFGNMYLSSIQQGIQAGHVIGEMSLKYLINNYGVNDEICRALYHEWVENHKTMVLLNAGYGAEIHELVTIFSHPDNDSLPWAFFKEGEDALDGALTCVGIILPDKIYELAKLIRDPEEFKIIEHSVVNSGDWLVNSDGLVWEYTKWEWDLVKRLNDYGLAR